MAEDNPYASPAEDRRYERPSGSDDRHYGGIGRLRYFLIALAVGLLIGTYTEVIAAPVSPEVVVASNIIQYIIGIWLAALRLNNIGYSPWLSLLVIVPLANLIIGVICLSCQQGYAQAKRLDTAGRVVLWLCIGAIVLSVAAVFFAITMLVTEMGTI